MWKNNKKQNRNRGKGSSEKKQRLNELKHEPGSKIKIRGLEP